MSNPKNRFEGVSYHPVDDFPPRLRIQYLADATKSIISYNDSPDVGFSASINIYRGCAHGCSYCYARPTHEYLGFSCGNDFESKIMVKHNAPELLRNELNKKSWSPQVLAMSGVTDTYQPIEHRLKLTRRCLEVLADFCNPVVIVTKNALVVRDIDVLSTLARMNGCIVYVSITTLDPQLSRKMEPRASLPRQRLAAVAALAESGVPVGVLVAPIVPGLNDSEIPSILESVADAGACTASYVMLRLPFAVKDVFSGWLDEHFPLRKAKVLNHVRGVRNGELNKSQFGERMRGTAPFAEHTARLFAVSRHKYGLGRPGPALSTEHFRRVDAGQLDLF